jgi:16S rRNA (guanine527-N7)-methyltransferase
MKSLRPGWQKYLDLLLLWNSRINLTAVRTPDEIIEKHFEDSLAVVPHIPADARTLADVGSGAGFPGAVIALERPDLQVTLVEPNHKKAAFLQTVKRDLALTNLSVKTARAESLAQVRDFMPFDAAVSRATWALPEWLRLGSTLVRPGGTVLGMEAAEQFPLPPGATRHPYPLGNATRSIIVFHVER